VPSNTDFNLRTARAAAERGELAVWVGDFLASPGSGNATLAAALAERELHWAGPVKIELDRLVPLAGPSDDEVCPIDPDEWEDDVDSMEDALEDGWEPPPLLAELVDGELYLQDGNHRRETLQRAGERDAWVVVWSDGPIPDDLCLPLAPRPPSRPRRRFSPRAGRSAASRRR
jgi:hypothetical protein